MPISAFSAPSFSECIIKSKFKHMSMFKLLNDYISVDAICIAKTITADDYEMSLQIGRFDMIKHMIHVLKICVPVDMLVSICNSKPGISDGIFIAALKLYTFTSTPNTSLEKTMILMKLIYHRYETSKKVSLYINSTPYHLLLHDYLDIQSAKLDTMRAKLPVIPVTPVVSKKRKLAE